MKKSFDHKWYTEEFLQELKATERIRMEGNLPITEKYAPDAVSDIAIDPRVFNGQQGRSAKAMALVPDFILNRISVKMDEKFVADMRRKCDQIASAKCVQEDIRMEDRVVAAEDGYPIPIRIYRSEQCRPGCECLYFMHGGGFVGGSIPPYDEACKLFVEKFHMVVISVAYRLMPENPYPTPHEDCYRVLQWIHENADALQIDRSRVFVSGDSAGGNLAQYCSTRSKGTGLVRGQLLLYATLNAFRIQDKYFKLDGKNFVYEPSQRRISRCLVKMMDMGTDLPALGFPKPDPYCNPYTSDPTGNPPTFISVGALDFLKNDNIAWAHKLQDAGVPLKVVVYNGVSHGYISAVGVFPQAEDLLDEMGAFIKGVCASDATP